MQAPKPLQTEAPGFRGKWRDSCISKGMTTRRTNKIMTGQRVGADGRILFVVAADGGRLTIR